MKEARHEEDQEKCPDWKEVKGMHEERAERQRQAARIKKQARSANNGRSYYLPGLWACRVSGGLSQRTLAQRIGSNQSTIRQLEGCYRGACVSTIRRLCTALGVAPEALLCGDSDK